MNYRHILEMLARVGLRDHGDRRMKAVADEFLASLHKMHQRFQLPFQSFLYANYSVIPLCASAYLSAIALYSAAEIVGS